MIISGLQTGRTRWLAAHLQNAADNETIELAEVSGTVATDIDGALAEMDALTAGTNAREGVYAAFINPPAPLTREQFMRALAIVEERLGLAGQPRIVLFHVKNGRHHCHAVWSRIDLETMKAIHLSHDRQKLRKCAQEIGAEFGLELPAGLRQDRGVARFADPARALRPTRAEKAQARHSGIPQEQRRAEITKAWLAADTGEAFAHALEELGYMLAKGDSRAFVVVDIADDVHSLARQIDGAKTKDVAKKLAGLNLSLLPSVERAKILMAQRLVAQGEAAQASEKRKAEAESAWKRLQDVQKKRRLQIDLLWQQMKIRHAHEWKVMHAHFKAERDRKLARRVWEAWGLALYLKKIAVIRQLLAYYDRKKVKALEEQLALLAAGLRRRQENEALELKRRYEAFTRLERREIFTFSESYRGFIDPRGYHAQHAASFVAAKAHGTYATWFTFHENIKEATAQSNLAAMMKPDQPETEYQEPMAKKFDSIVAFCENAADMTVPAGANALDTFRQNAADITTHEEGFSVQAKTKGGFSHVTTAKITLGTPLN